jgi:sugar phosphate isomerase/epimerase
MLTRRQFGITSVSAALAAVLKAEAAPLKLGHRQANMTTQPGPGVFDIARQIPGITGVELQVQFQKTTLWDRDTLLTYKRGAADAGLLIPSLAGVWAAGASLVQPGPAEETIRKSIQAADALKARVILIAAFQKNCPIMDQEESYGPVVAMLRKVAGAAADAGVTLGMETSLSPADDKKLIDLVAKPSVQVYYDADNVERFGHKDEAVPGYEVLGKSRLAQIHVKNEEALLEEPGRVNWTAAFKAIRRVGYQGWLVFESSHSSPEQCIEATKKNIAFIRRQFA